MLGLGHFPPGSVVDPYVPDLLSNIKKISKELPIFKIVTKLNSFTNENNDFEKQNSLKELIDFITNFEDMYHLDQDDGFP